MLLEIESMVKCQTKVTNSGQEGNTRNRFSQQVQLSMPTKSTELDIDEFKSRRFVTIHPEMELMAEHIRSQMHKSNKKN